jgi:hypothetical protein
MPGSNAPWFRDSAWVYGVSYDASQVPVRRFGRHGCENMDTVVSS